MIGSFVFARLARAAWIYGLTIICLVVLSSAAWAGSTYFTWQLTPYDNDCGVDGEGHSIPCCTVDGWDSSGNNKLHPKCPTLISAAKIAMSCATDQPLDVPPRIECPRICSCGDAHNPFCGDFDVTQHPDKSIDPGTYQCDRNNTGGEPEQCDGLSAGTIPVDQGCGSDEHKCNIGDSDPAPVRYSSGRVESNPITLFSVAAPEPIFFGYKIMYNSQVMRTAAKRNTVNAVHDTFPTIHHSEEDTHYIGLGWLDNYSDRLYVTGPNTPSTQITWTSQNGTVTFINTAGAWKSWSGKLELLPPGSPQGDGGGRWVVRTVDPSAPRQIWSFEEFKYAPYDGSPEQTLGRLRRHAVLNSNMSDLSGRYGYSVTWTTKGQISDVVDTLGRRFTFVYKDELECLQRDPQKQPPDGLHSLRNCLDETCRGPLPTERYGARLYHRNAATYRISRQRSP